MRIELLYSPGCPGLPRARQRLEAVLRARRIGDPVVEIPVETAERAAQLNFPGSPTIRVDGRDVADDVPSGVALACRIYPTQEGCDTAPPVGMIERAIRMAQGFGLNGCGG